MNDIVSCGECKGHCPTPESCRVRLAEVAKLCQNARRYLYLKEILSERSKHADIAAYNGNLDATLDHLITVFPLPSQGTQQEKP